MIAFLALLVAAFIPVGMAQAQQLNRNMPLIGYLGTTADATAGGARVLAFRQGLQEVGYVEGKTINIAYRYVEGRAEQLDKVIAELVRMDIDVIVVPNDLTARAVKNITPAIPIIMASSGNPIGTGVIVSLARPGGNVTGLTSYTAELFGKRLEILKQASPKISHVAFLSDVSRGGTSASMAAFKETEGAAKSLEIRLQSLGVKAPNPDFAGAFQAIARNRIDALITSPGPLLSFHRKTILELLDKSRLPAMHSTREWTDAGGLISYGSNVEDQYRRAATYVDKILKGTKPADLPVEQPTKFELVINLKTAKQIGVTIPPNVLTRADRVIK